MLILDKLRAIDLLVSRSEPVRIPDEFRWGRTDNERHAIASVRDADGRRRLTRPVILGPAVDAHHRPPLTGVPASPPFDYARKRLLPDASPLSA